jgi:hypothetical protein
VIYYLKILYLKIYILVYYLRILYLRIYYLYIIIYISVVCSLLSVVYSPLSAKVHFPTFLLSVFRESVRFGCK